jgi:hypothetical protein
LSPGYPKAEIEAQGGDVPKATILSRLVSGVLR